MLWYKIITPLKALVRKYKWSDTESNCIHYKHVLVCWEEKGNKKWNYSPFEDSFVPEQEEVFAKWYCPLVAIIGTAGIRRCSVKQNLYDDSSI